MHFAKSVFVIVQMIAGNGDVNVDAKFKKALKTFTISII